MYLHLGQSVIVPTKDVVGIFDLDNSSHSYITRDFLKNAELNKRVFSVSEELPKSFVLVEGKGETRVYVSQLSSATLLKRSAEFVL